MEGGERRGCLLLLGGLGCGCLAALAAWLRHTHCLALGRAGLAH